MHFNEGQLKAFIDDELDGPLWEQVNDHLESCLGCQTRLAELAAQAERVQALVELTAPRPSEAAVTAQVARARFDIFVSRKESNTMFEKLFPRRYRPVWFALGLIIILVIGFAVPQVRAIANSFLGLFRLQQFAVVQVNPGTLPEQLGSSAQLESMLSQDVRFEEFGEPQEVSSVADASELSGIPVRLPTAIEGEMGLLVTPAARATFNIDLQHVQVLLGEIGYSDVQFPPELDGAVVTVDLPNGVTAAFGECEFDSQAAREEGYDPDDPDTPRLPRCTTLVQIPSPSISAPPGLDVSGIGQAFLQILGMSAEDAARFSENIDWTTTLVVPIPINGTQYQEVPVDGVTGTLILQEMDDQPLQYLLMWVKGGIVYALTGPGSSTTALTIADSLE